MTSHLPTSAFRIWLAAIRPKTLPASIAPVLMGTFMAFGDGVEHWVTALVTLMAAILIQVGTNFANDYYDYQNGVDTSERTGPLRVVQAGLVKPQSMRCAFILAFLFAAMACYYLYLRAGWPIALIAVAAVCSGIFYTAGPFPFGYLGLGEIFVFIFFGPVAVAGTYYVQSFELNRAVIMSGFIPGLFSTAIIAVNNLRDRDTDAQVGKKTLAVRFGPTFARFEYFACISIAALLPIPIYFKTQDHLRTLYAPFILLMAFPAFRRVFQDEGTSLNNALAYTGLLLLVYTLAFVLGWIL